MISAWHCTIVLLVNRDWLTNVNVLVGGTKLRSVVGGTRRGRRGLAEAGCSARDGTLWKGGSQPECADENARKE
ncbi:hypothetical protein Mal15_35330 [Stieleria maiorica]|uniref:Uncharacterized protein n=1 Tax=Stieleria maiorica TaxID=2795974 RepID=A0A5B9MEE3_9BACT|nr:hypothetical protein Mal15_35330 [Stieleria maiorica]